MIASDSIDQESGVEEAFILNQTIHEIVIFFKFR